MAGMEGGQTQLCVRGDWGEKAFKDLISELRYYKHYFRSIELHFLYSYFSNEAANTTLLLTEGEIGSGSILILTCNDVS